jgi:tRNA A37 threonylcarbamoyladenosine modification protein TsaB
VAGFSSLEALAFSSDEDLKGVVAMVDAYQKQVFAGWRSPSAAAFVEEAVAASAWCAAHLAELVAEGPVRFCGTGAAVYYDKEILPAAAKLGISTARLSRLTEVLHVSPSGIARAIGKELATRGVEGALLPYARLRANYMRPSQAEIKLIESGADKP